jgi:hypothetical protein
MEAIVSSVIVADEDCLNYILTLSYIILYNFLSEVIF